MVPIINFTESSSPSGVSFVAWNLTIRLGKFFKFVDTM